VYFIWRNRIGFRIHRLPAFFDDFNRVASTILALTVSSSLSHGLLVTPVALISGLAKQSEQRSMPLATKYDTGFGFSDCCTEFSSKTQPHRKALAEQRSRRQEQQSKRESFHREPHGIRRPKSYRRHPELAKDSAQA